MLPEAAEDVDHCNDRDDECYDPDGDRSLRWNPVSRQMDSKSAVVILGFTEVECTGGK